MSDAVIRIGERVVQVTLGGGQGPRGFGSGDLGAESVGAEELNGDDMPALRARLGITGEVLTLSADTVLATFEPRPGDAYNLNGKTLTIERMPDTALTNLFRGAGKVILKGGIARPEWWQGVSYRAAAVALTAGGGGTVLLGLANYPSESSFANPLPIANVRFSGAALPEFSANNQELVGGSRLVAPVIVASQKPDGSQLGHNVVFEDLGIDAGAVVCGDDGPDLEALIFSNIGPSGTPNPAVELRKGIVVRRVRTLCRNPTSTGHGVLIESAEGPVIEEVETVFGGTGMVLKSRKGVMRKCRNRGHGVSPGLIKSDAYSPAFDNLIDDCQASSVSGADTGPYRVQAATASAARNTLRDVRCEGTSQWISIETLGANNNVDAKVIGGSSEAARFGGLTVSATDPDTGTGRITGLVVQGVTINNVQELVPGADYIGNAIYLGAKVERANITGCQIYGTAGDGVLNKGASVVVTGTTALMPGTTKHGFNGVSGDMKVPSGSNIGTTAGSVAT